MLELFGLLVLAFAVYVAFQVLRLVLAPVLLPVKLALVAVKLVLVVVGFLVLMALGLPLLLALALPLLVAGLVLWGLVKLLA
jgi:hypothetical protein